MTSDGIKNLGLEMGCGTQRLIRSAKVCCLRRHGGNLMLMYRDDLSSMGQHSLSKSKLVSVGCDLMRLSQRADL